MEAKIKAIIIYPVVSSRGRDNTGGYDHFYSNLIAYRVAGIKCIAICRLAWPLVDVLNHVVVFNVIPGRSNPSTKQEDVSGGDGNVLVESIASILALVGKCRTFLVRIFLFLCVLIYQPLIIHQRANKRFLSDIQLANGVSIIELNDKFVPDFVPDLYLSVERRSDLHAPQFVSPWPVSAVAEFDQIALEKRLFEIESGNRIVNVLLFGVGGISNYADIGHFVQDHIWFSDKRAVLHVFGETDFSDDGADNVIFHGHIGAKALDASKFDVGLLYYDTHVYDEDRIRLGSPTKFFKYVDWSLPVITNNDFYSTSLMGGFDKTKEIFYDSKLRDSYIEFLRRSRNTTSVESYGFDLRNRILGLISEKRLRKL